MPTIQIPSLPPVSSIDGDEQIPMRDALGDVKVTLDQVSNFVKSELTPEETLAKVIASNPQANGLNANLLQGLAAPYFRNASNLNTGIVDPLRLPQGDHNYFWNIGGLYPQAGSLKGMLKLGDFIAGGSKIMIQWGWTNFVYANTDIQVPFYESFTGGWGTENKPLVMVVPECRGSEWNGPTSSSAGPSANVELTMAAYYTHLSFFKCSSTRIGGGLADTVRGNWIAIGYYD